jgi:hypothetical protein
MTRFCRRAPVMARPLPAVYRPFFEIEASSWRARFGSSCRSSSASERAWSRRPASRYAWPRKECVCALCGSTSTDFRYASTASAGRFSPAAAPSRGSTTPPRFAAERLPPASNCAKATCPEPCFRASRLSQRYWFGSSGKGGGWVSAGDQQQRRCGRACDHDQFSHMNGAPASSRCTTAG